MPSFNNCYSFRLYMNLAREYVEQFLMITRWILVHYSLLGDIKSWVLPVKSFEHFLPIAISYSETKI